MNVMQHLFNADMQAYIQPLNSSDSTVGIGISLLCKTRLHVYRQPSLPLHTSDYPYSPSVHAVTGHCAIIHSVNRTSSTAVNQATPLTMNCGWQQCPHNLLIKCQHMSRMAYSSNLPFAAEIRELGETRIVVQHTQKQSMKCPFAAA